MITFKHKDSKLIKKVPQGFSFTTLFLGLLFMRAFAFSADLTFAGEDIQAKSYNDVLENFEDMPMRVYYSITNKEPTIIVTEFMEEYRITFDTKQLSKVSNAIDKYLEWEKIAVANKVTVEKEISRIEIKPIFQFGDDWYNSHTSKIIFEIFSQSKLRHQLIINFMKYQATSNEFIKFRPATLYLEKKEVIKLQKQLTAEYREKVITKFKENEKKENNLFK